MKIHVDFETFSSADLPAIGAYRYAADPSTGIWLMGYAIDNNEPQLWYPDDPVPTEFFDQQATFYAHNVMFERAIWTLIATYKYGFPKFDINRWHCTKSMAAYHALPTDGTSLEKVGKVLGCKHQKDQAGKKLMMRMSKSRIFIPMFPGEDDPEIKQLGEYCRDDVRAERDIEHALAPLPEIERQAWLLDQEINWRGIQVDVKLCREAIRIRDAELQRYEKEIRELTDNRVLSTTQIDRISEWAAYKGVVVESLDEQSVSAALADPDCPEDVRRVFEIRQITSLSSLAKYQKMESLADETGRMRDGIEYYGAFTGRWAGRGAQIQNFPRGEGEDTVGICDTILAGRDMVEIFYGPNVLSTLKGGLRGALTAKYEHTLAIWDYAQIEARVLAWLAGEQRLLKGFREKADIYKMFAAAIYSIAADSISKLQRNVGKQSVLGLGYGMGAPKFQATLAGSRIELPLTECERIREVYRSSFPRIPALWKEIDRLWRRAVTSREPSSFGGILEFGHIWKSWGDAVTIKLPSGRSLFYWHPEVDHTGGSYKSGNFRKRVYGGLLVENLCQAIARDIMVTGMLRLRQTVDLVATVHDEIIAEVPEDRAAELVHWGEQEMSIPPKWASSIPLGVEGFYSERYRK